MKVIDTKFKGLKIIQQKRIGDSRGSLRETFRKKIIYPIHPRTMSKINKLEIPKGIKLIKPLGFDLSNSNLIRAGLDYHDLANLTVFHLKYCPLNFL